MIADSTRLTLVVERMHLAVCVPCQYDCLSCSHQAMRYKFRGYDLPLDHLQEFIHFTETSGYLIRKLQLTGPGEPLLWKNLKEGLRLLRASPAIGEICIISNGLSIHRIDDETWKNLDQVQISLYPAFNKSERLNLAARVLDRELY
jgi:molybdenum cofactor biosynthesis enzyme MoaA